VTLTREVYRVFGFERIEVTLQTRPEKFLGRIELWDAAETALRRCLERSGFSVKILPGEGAFYGPKIGFDFRDVLERSWTLATVQIDCAMPERFGLKYVTADGTEASPVMLHRAVLGSIERFIAILLEHCAGAFPLWLAPVQLKVLTVTDDHKEYAVRVVDLLKGDGWRVEFDARNEKLGYKIREAQLAKVPYAVIIGDKEVAAESVAPRRRGGENVTPLPVSEFIRNLHAEVAQELGEA
jgi:threonyl-tRNA synthetase